MSLCLTDHDISLETRASGSDLQRCEMGWSFIFNLSAVSTEMSGMQVVGIWEILVFWLWFRYDARDQNRENPGKV